jgi:hypothetical protein
MSIEAMRQAREALNVLMEAKQPIHSHYIIAAQAIEAIDAALAAPAEPVAEYLRIGGLSSFHWLKSPKSLSVDGEALKLYTTPPAPEAPTPTFPEGVAEHEQWRMSSVIEAAWQRDAQKLALALMSMPATRAEMEADESQGAAPEAQALREALWKCERAEAKAQEERTRHMNFVLDLHRVINWEPTLCSFPEIEEVRAALASSPPAVADAKDAAPELCRDADGDVCIDYSNAEGMLSMSFAPDGRISWACNAKNGSNHGSVTVAPIVFQVLDAELRAASTPSEQP